MTVKDVLETRCKQEGIEGTTPDQLAKAFCSKSGSKAEEAGDLRGKCRLRAKLYEVDSLTGNVFVVSECVSGVVSDTNRVSDLKFISGPSSWCNRGGLDMVMAATKPQGDPVLMLEDGAGRRVALHVAYPSAKPIQTSGSTSGYEACNGTCKFRIPDQPDEIVKALASDAR